MKTIKTYMLLWLALGLVMVSCKKDDPDTVAPTAEFMSPVAETEYHRGQSLICKAVFKDNEDLSHVDVSIMSLKGFDTPWDARERISLSGTSFDMSAYELFEGAIPMEIMSGSYVLNFTVVDKAQNNSRYSINIEVN